MSGLMNTKHEGSAKCKICGREGGMPTALRSNTHMFESLLPASFLSMFLCEDCVNFAVFIAKAARAKALQRE